MIQFSTVRTFCGLAVVLAGAFATGKTVARLPREAPPREPGAVLGGKVNPAVVVTTGSAAWTDQVLTGLDQACAAHRMPCRFRPRVAASSAEPLAKTLDWLDEALEKASPRPESVLIVQAGPVEGSQSRQLRRFAKAWQGQDVTIETAQFASPASCEAWTTEARQRACLEHAWDALAVSDAGRAELRKILR